MRPLIVFSGQGIARADGFNLTRRAKALPELRSVVSRLNRSDRQNLDAIFACAVGSGVPSAQWIGALRALCLKERRTTVRKRAHWGVFRALAEAGKFRPVVHLTSNVDGLTTTFLVRDFGARWAPYHDSASIDEVRRDVARVFGLGAGIVHFPLHGEIGLYVSEPSGDRLRTAYHHPEADGDGTSWVSSLVVGPGRGLGRIESHMPTSRLACHLVHQLLRGGAVAMDDGVCLGDLPAADLLVIGYGAHEQGCRVSHPFERILRSAVRDGARDAGGSWSVLLAGGTTSRRVVRWYHAHGFEVVRYAEDELPTCATVRLRGTGLDRDCVRSTSA